MRLTRLLLAKALVLATLVAVPVHASAATSAASKTKHCTMSVVGQDATTGRLLATDPVCTTGPTATTMSGGAIAVHYTGFNYSGSSLTILGDGCYGGWLNLPAGWTNQIASTISGCLVGHWDYYYLSGESEYTWGSGNLSSMAYRANSVQYS